MTLGSKLLASGKDRVIGLDILRGIAILLVMYEHGNSLLPTKFIKYFTLPRPSIDGVSLFFVLSGFLIGGILLKIINTSRFTIRDILNFWIQRWLRTIPNYYFILLILILCQFLLAKDIGQVNFRYFLFSQNLYQPHPLFFPEAWSLSIEEWFYLLFPILTFLLFSSLKDKNKSVIIAAIVFLIIPLVLRIIKYYCQIGVMDWDLNFRKIIILRLDSLMYGIIGAYILTYRNIFWQKMKKIGLIISGLIILFLIIYSSLKVEKEMFSTIYHYNLESLAVLFALPFFSELKSIKYKRIALLFTFISLISYSMYLINLTLIREIAVPFILNFIGLSYGISSFLNIISHLLQFFLFWVLTIFFSYFLYMYLELPIMNFRNRLKFRH
jgi:peptidoglycan/LPS O-acetylase OafA/YrhL